jgi:hypothetical protein
MLDGTMFGATPSMIWCLVMDIDSEQDLLLVLPKIGELGATNYALIQQAMRQVLEQLTQLPMTSEREFALSAAQQINKLLQMLEDQRDALRLVTLSRGATVETAPVSQSAATYLQLYESSVLAGKLAAASPWFDRYLDCVGHETFGTGAAASRSNRKWRGPFSRPR